MVKKAKECADTLKTASSLMHGIEGITLKPWMRFLLKAEKRSDGSDVLSFHRYYRLIGMIDLFIAFMYLAIIIMGKIYNETNTAFIISCMLIIVSMFFSGAFTVIVCALRDKEDEMFMDTQSRINSTFISILSIAGCVSAIVLSSFHIHLQMSGDTIFCLVYALAAVRNFIGLYYEKRFEISCKED